MRFLLPGFVLLILITVLGKVQAWYLDESCHRPIKSAKSCPDSDDSDSDESDIEMGMGSGDTPVEYLQDMSSDLLKIIQSSFGLATNAQSALDALKQGQSNEAQMDVLEFMYASAVQYNDGKERTVKSDHFDIITSIFDQILGFKHQAPSHSKGDVGFFCDYSRYAEDKDHNGNDNPGWAWDRKLQKSVKMDDIFKECRDLIAGDGEDWFWFADARAANGEEPSIQLCQGFFDIIREDEYKIWEDISSDLENALSRIETSRFTEDVPITDMDKASRYDQYVVHELSHVIAKHATNDRRQEYSYGWDNCLRISNQAKQLPDEYEASYMNADSAANAAQGFTIVSPGGKFEAHRPLKNGKIVPFQMTTKASGK
ncbi:hypothetical protein N7492_000884 [Penicillium capsulatum]|uniref:Lysine-specific metallo-endopeptidase domain-containing protein n=1 Tax=Penicillium capsulatum TaxID=69766 RepID=A0A9W9IQE9_9EURO|nr:hypothetical protein N7492_000884 [Penicillium capsulatum]KAJ6130059.1 hypothetical protein N7512_002839 [Penicillium capsulatum]